MHFINNLNCFLFFVLLFYIFIFFRVLRATLAPFASGNSVFSIRYLKSNPLPVKLSFAPRAEEL